MNRDQFLLAMKQGSEEGSQAFSGGQRMAQAQMEKDAALAQLIRGKQMDEAAKKAQSEQSVRSLGDYFQVPKEIPVQDVMGEVGKKTGKDYGITVDGDKVSVSPRFEPTGPIAANARQIENKAADYSKRLEKVNDFNSALSEWENITNRDGKGGALTNPDVKLLSTGKVASTVPTGLVGALESVGVLPKGASEERKVLQRLKNEYLSAKSGQAVSAQEAARADQAFGMMASPDPALVAKGVRALAGIMQSRIKTIQGGYSPESREMVHSVAGNPTDLYKGLAVDADLNRQKNMQMAPTQSSVAETPEQELARLKAKHGKR